MVRLVAPAVLVGLLVAMFASGCAGFDLEKRNSCGPYEPPVTTRTTAVACAHQVYDVAVRQSVPLDRVSCIYNTGRPDRWVVVVDVTGERSFRKAARLCPAFAYGEIEHAVVLDRDGNVRFAQ